MNALLAGMDSLKLTRLARRDPSLLLVPCDAPRPEDCGPVPPEVLRQALPQELSGFSAKHPISLAALSRETRSQSACVKPLTVLTALPPASFLEVVRADGGYWSGAGELVRLFVESPGLNLVHMSRRMGELVKRGTLSEGAALARLLSLVMESCGLYARDPLRPAEGQCAYDVEPQVRADDLRAYVNGLGRMRGLHLAREAARFAHDGSGSPGETVLSLVMRLPPRRGGIPLPDFEENVPIAWPAGVRGLVRHGTMRPDFHWPQHRVASEFDGGMHGLAGALAEDRFRAQDYAACDIVMVPATYADIKSIAAIERYVTLVAHKLARCEDDRFLRRVSDSVKDPRAREERAVLLSQLLPPDVRRGC